MGNASRSLGKVGEKEGGEKSANCICRGVNVFEQMSWRDPDDGGTGFQVSLVSVNVIPPIIHRCNFEDDGDTVTR